MRANIWSSLGRDTTSQWFIRVHDSEVWCWLGIPSTEATLPSLLTRYKVPGQGAIQPKAFTLQTPGACCPQELTPLGGKKRENRVGDYAAEIRVHHPSRRLCKPTSR